LRPGDGKARGLSGERDISMERGRVFAERSGLQLSEETELSKISNTQRSRSAQLPFNVC